LSLSCMNLSPAHHNLQHTAHVTANLTDCLQQRGTHTISATEDMERGLFGTQ